MLHAAEGEDEEPDAAGDEDIEDMREERLEAELVPTDAEKQVWLAKVKKFHPAAGHPENRNLAQMVRDVGHRSAWCWITSARSVKHSDQVEVAQGRSWSQVGIDIAEWLPPNSQKKYKFILFMGMATKYKVVDAQPGPTASGIGGASFAARWLMDTPKPLFVTPDSSKTLTSTKLGVPLGPQHCAAASGREGRMGAWCH